MHVYIYVRLRWVLSRAGTENTHQESHSLRTVTVARQQSAIDRRVAGCAPDTAHPARLVDHVTIVRTTNVTSKTSVFYIRVRYAPCRPAYGVVLDKAAAVKVARCLNKLQRLLHSNPQIVCTTRLFPSEPPPLSISNPPDLNRIFLRYCCQEYALERFAN